MPDKKTKLCEFCLKDVEHDPLCQICHERKAIYEVYPDSYWDSHLRVCDLCYTYILAIPIEWDINNCRNCNSHKDPILIPLKNDPRVFQCPECKLLFRKKSQKRIRTVCCCYNCNSFEGRGTKANWCNQWNETVDKDKICEKYKQIEGKNND